MRRIWAFSLRTKNGITNEMAIALAYPGSWTDVSEQIDSELNDLPVMIALGEVPSANFSAINTSPEFLIIGFQEVDDITGQVTNTNLNNTLSAAQVTAAKAWFTGKWSNISTKILDEIAAGKSRQQAAKDLVRVVRRIEQAQEALNVNEASTR